MMLWDVRTRHPMTVACRYYYPTSESAAYLDNGEGEDILQIRNERY